MKKLLLLTFTLAATLVACQKNEAVKAAGERTPVQFSVANLGTYQFKSTAAIGQEGTSTVAIYAADLGANHVEANVSGSTLTPTSAIYWGIGQTASTSFCARYPYVNADASGEYSIPADQTSLETYSYHENVVTAVTVASPSTEGGVLFNFTHPFAKVVVNVTNNLGGDAVTSVKLTDMKCTASTFNVAVLPAVTTLANTTSDMTGYCSATNVYNFVVMPQSAQPNIVVTTAQGSVYTFALSAEYTFEAGKIATTTVKLDPVGGSGSNNTASAVSFSFTATDWAAATSNPANTESSKAIGNYWHVIGCVYDDAHKNITNTPAWKYDYAMTFTGNDVWTITINYDENMAAASSAGFKLRRFSSSTEEASKWTTQYGFQTTTEDSFKLVDKGDYQNLSNSGSSKNIRLASAGQWTITLTNDDLTVTRKGDVTSAIVTQ